MHEVPNKIDPQYVANEKGCKTMVDLSESNDFFLPLLIPDSVLIRNLPIGKDTVSQ